MWLGERIAKRTASLPILLTLVTTTAALGAPTAAQKRQVEALENRLKKAGQLFSDHRYRASAAEVQAIRRDYERLCETKDPELIDLLAPIHTRLEKAREKLQEQGLEIPPFTKPGGGGIGPAASAVSFVRQVAPLLAGKCGRCHVDNARGEFRMASYSQLMKGSAAGVVIFPGDPQGSRLIEMIESGDMPRGGGKLSAEELTLLKQWVKEGARFDGSDQQAGLRSLASATASAAPKALGVVKATGKETVSFARDIAPVLAANCTGCHVNPQNARGNLNMTTFAQLLRGGDSGPPLVPGMPKESLIVQRLLGEGGGPRMPMGRDPLPDAVISKVEQWITEGATYDGGDASQNVTQVAALAKARSATHEELTAERARLAGQNWRLGMPNIESARWETEHFLLLGNVGDATLRELGKRVEAVLPRLNDLFDIPADQPLIRGRMTLYVFRQRYDYAEFGQMVEKRQIPTEWRGHWRFTVVDAYGAVVPSPADEYSFEALAAQQIAGTYLASLGPSVPRWFAEGAARVVASRIAAKDPRVTSWDGELAGVLSAMTKADDFLTGKLSPEQIDVAAYSFMKALMRNNNAFPALLNALREGQEFDQAFTAVYRGSPAQAAAAWAAGAARTAKRKR